MCSFLRIPRSLRLLTLSLFVFMVFLFVAGVSASAKLILVNKNAAGAPQDGASWRTAFVTVKGGVATAVSGDEVWVAAPTPAVAAYVENFTLPEGVRLFGGFAGTETARDERDWIAHETVLEGSGNYNTDIVTTSGNGASIDGFTIRKGRSGIAVISAGAADIANCTFSSNQNGVRTGSYGGATITCCTFTANEVGVNGSAKIAHCLISGNQDGVWANWYCTTTVTDSFISGNNNGIHVNGDGTALRCTITGNTSGVYAYNGGLIIANCVISANTTGVSAVRSATTLTNCTVSGNATGASIDEYYGGTTAVANCIVAYNGTGIFWNPPLSGETMTLSHTDVYGNTSADYVNRPVPSGTGGSINVDPRFVDLGHGDYHLVSGSPCIDQGDDSVVTTDMTDLEGRPRTIGQHADIGAYEFVRCVFSQEPLGASAGVSFTHLPIVLTTDDSSRPFSDYNGLVSISIKAGTGTVGATLSGTTTVMAVKGVAAFSNLSIDKAGAGFVLVSSCSIAAPVESLPFNVYAPPSHFVFTTQPDLGEAGKPFQQQPVVLARDENNVLIPDYNGPVTLAIKAGTGTPGAALTGTTTIIAVNGVATFTDLGINHKGTGYVLEAFAGTNKLGESAPFDVAPKAERLLFRVDPGGAEDDWVFSQQPNVSVVDADGDIATLNRSDITVAIKPGTGTAGATLSGKTTVTALHGLAWFTGIGIEKVGAGYVLTASSPGLASADSMAFDVAEAPKLVLRQSAADEIEVSVHPAGKTIIGAPVDLSWDESELAPIRASDVQAANGWHVDTLDTAAGCTAVLSSAGTTTNGPILTLHLAAQSGFSGRSASVDLTEFIDLTDDGYNTIPVLSRSVQFIPGAHLAFTRQPVLTTAGQIIAGQPTVAMLDGTQSVVADFADPVSMAIKPGTGTADAVLGGTTSVDAAAGIAVFSGLTIDRKGLGYVLLASSGPFTTESLAFDIAPKALKLAFTTQPGNARAGLPMAPQPVVAVQDDDGATAFAFSGPIALAIKSGTGFPGTTPAGTATLNAVSGVAAFSDVRIGTAAPGYVLTASGQSLTGAESAAFDVTPFAFTTADVRDAIRWAAGISPVPAGYVGRFDVVPNGAVDLRDAVRIARKAVGLETNP